MNIAQVVEDFNDGKAQRYKFFDGGELSQFFKCSFSDQNTAYTSAEQYMMSQKALVFHDKDSFYRIMNADRPVVCKSLGRKIKGFKQDLWDSVKFDIVVEGNYLKFSQNQKLKSFLLETDDRILVETSPTDAIWGIKYLNNYMLSNPNYWIGENLLGFAIMEARDKLDKGK